MDAPARGLLRHARRLMRPPGWAIALLLSAAVTALAQEGPGEDDVLSFDTKPPELLVLFDGRVLRGQIIEVAGGYQITDSNLRQALPYEYVRVAASSLEEAYVKLRDAMRKPTAGDHLALGRWCYDNEMYPQATEQLADALKLEPGRSEALALLQKVADANPEQFGGAPGQPAAAESSSHDTSPLTSMGISLETQAEFVRRIQPIMVKRCGNARCHGSAATNDFQLRFVQKGQRHQQRETHDNLAAVLKYVDASRGDSSPLLDAATDGSSPAHRSVFLGRAGTVHASYFREWVERAERDLRRGEPAESLWAENDSQGVVPAAFESETPSARRPFESDVSQTAGTAAHQERVRADMQSPLLIEIPRTPLAKPSAAPTAPVRSAGRDVTLPRRPPSFGPEPTTPERMTQLRRILEQERPDAFDPEEFNRRVHGVGQ